MQPRLCIAGAITMHAIHTSHIYTNMCLCACVCEHAHSTDWRLGSMHVRNLHMPIQVHISMESAILPKGWKYLNTKGLIFVPPKQHFTFLKQFWPRELVINNEIAINFLRKLYGSIREYTNRNNCQLGISLYVNMYNTIIITYTNFASTLPGQLDLVSLQLH